MSLAYQQDEIRARSTAAAIDGKERADQRRFSRPAGYELQPLPGSEFPTILYVVIIGVYGWMFGAAWYAFGGEPSTKLVLAMATVLAVVFFGIPMTMRKTAAPRLSRPRQTVNRLRIATAHVETATGSLPAWHAWIEVLLIPLALAVAATLIGAAYLAVG